MASPPRQHAATQPVAAPAPSLSSSALMLSSASLRASFPPVATAANRYQYDHAVHAAHAGTQDYTFSASQLNVSSSALASSMNTSAVFASGGGGDASAAGGTRSMNPLRMSAEAVRLRALTAAVSGRVGASSTAAAATTAATLGSASSAAAATRESLQDDAGLRDDNALSTAAQLEHETRRLMQQHQQRKQHEQQSRP
jgi:hypothetical protein